MKQYRIVTVEQKLNLPIDEASRRLEEKVNDLIKMKWMPVGGVAVRSATETSQGVQLTSLLQAMIRD